MVLVLRIYCRSLAVVIIFPERVVDVETFLDFLALKQDPLSGGALRLSEGVDAK